MWLSLILFVLILAITFFQSTHGLFSAIIMTVLTLCCAAAAVGTHEWVAVHWVAPYWRPDYSYAVALAALFGVPLIVLRLAADRLIRRSCLLPSWVDRFGGGFCGFFTALTTVGILALSLESLPFDGSILGFRRVALPSREVPDNGPKPKPPALDAPEREILLRPDRFVVGLTSLLSSGLFSGDRLFAVDHPDLVRMLGWVGAVPGEVSRYAASDSISIVRTTVVPYVYDYTHKPREEDLYEKVDPPSGHEFRMIRVKLHDAARDARKSHVFTLRQFRLVGRESDTGLLEMFFPVAIQQEDASQPLNRHIRRKWTRWGMWPVVDDLFSPRDDNHNEVEIVFDLPTSFSPVYLAYKRGARVSVSFGEASEPASPSPSKESPSATAPSNASPPPASPAKDRSARRSRSSRQSASAKNRTSRRRRRGGRVRGVTTRANESIFGDALPMKMTSYHALRNLLEVTGETLEAGHIVGAVDQQQNGTKRPIVRFAVPRDKRLLQLSTDRLHARSGLGRALAKAASTVQNYFVEDDAGRRYRMIGQYAIANVGGKRIVEIQYFPHQAGSIGGLGPFEKIKERHLTRNYRLVLLFLVEPGSKITSFSTGGSATRRDDLRSENLVAPK